MSATISVHQATSLEDVQEFVRDSAKVLAVGAGTKPALSSAMPGTATLDMRALNGIAEYEPAEYTITAKAGTPVAEIEEALRKNGQYLPFDPVLVRAGSTIGGMVASGLSGSGRLRYGGIRDFILGVRFVDGKGRLIRGGGKVVKNAAGFDFPKLLVGSLGRLGIVIDASFKVFPRPSANATVLADFASLDAALGTMQELSVSPIELIAVDLVVLPSQPSYTLALRIGGAPELLSARLDKLQEALPEASVLRDARDADYWSEVSEFTWVDPTFALVKTPLTPSRIPDVERELDGAQHVRRYSVAGNVLWLPWHEAVDSLGPILAGLGVNAVVLRGDTTNPIIGQNTSSAFSSRVRAAIDPEDVFQSIFPE